MFVSQHLFQRENYLNIIIRKKNKIPRIRRNAQRTMVFCYQNCSDLLWEKIVLVIEKNLKFEAEGREFANFLRGLFPRKKNKIVIFCGFYFKEIAPDWCHFFWKQWNFLNNGILLPKLFWPTVRKNCSSDWEKLISGLFPIDA